MPFAVATFYKFVDVADPDALRSALSEFCAGRDIRGTLLVAREGLNGTISAPDRDTRDMLAFLRADPRFADLVSKEQSAPAHPFGRLKIRVKREIVTLGTSRADPARRTGIPVAPRDWNALIADPDVTVLDTRNAFEIEIGTFPGAIDPGTRSFGEFPDFVAHCLDPRRHRRIAMFCTGGIRCEKASSYLLAQGFPEVYQLAGGILAYLETVPAAESLWRGDCFVFDARVALGPDLEAGSHVMCRTCGRSVSAGETCATC